MVWVGIGPAAPGAVESRAMRERLGAPVLIAVGAAPFDFHAACSARRPPGWAATASVELPPRARAGRLWRRYARYNPRFVAAFARPVRRGPARAPRQGRLMALRQAVRRPPRPAAGAPRATWRTFAALRAERGMRAPPQCGASRGA